MNTVNLLFFPAFTSDFGDLGQSTSSFFVPLLFLLSPIAFAFRVQASFLMYLYEAK